MLTFAEANQALLYTVIGIAVVGAKQSRRIRISLIAILRNVPRLLRVFFFLSLGFLVPLNVSCDMNSCYALYEA
jgi:ABC-type amino acid transport system permease subunit